MVPVSCSAVANGRSRYDKLGTILGYLYGLHPGARMLLDSHNNYEVSGLQRRNEDEVGMIARTPKLHKPASIHIACGTEVPWVAPMGACSVGRGGARFGAIDRVGDGNSWERLCSDVTCKPERSAPRDAVRKSTRDDWKRNRGSTLGLPTSGTACTLQEETHFQCYSVHLHSRGGMHFGFEVG